MLKTIQICSVIISILTFLVILFKHKRNRYQKLLLLTYIFSLTFYAYLLFLNKSGLIVDFPHLWNVGTPINFLHLATFMLFTRSILQDLKSPKKTDIIILFLPILSLIAMIPFYLKSASYKINHISYILKNEDAIFYATEIFIPAYWNYIIQFSVGIIFSFIAVLSIFKKININKQSNFRSVFIWLLCVGSLMFIGNLIGLLSLVFDSSTFDAHSLDVYIFGLYIIIIFLYPFFEPKVLYGTLLDINKKTTSNSDKKIELSSSELKEYKNKIHLFFTSKSNYLKADFRQDDLANHLEVSKSKLTQITLNIYDKKFNQLINEKRIEVVLRKFKNSEWLNYSLEGVALEVGFKSRTTFIKAFKEKTNFTPSEYKKANTQNIL